MAPMLEQLGEDHRRMAYLLDILERELGRFEAAREADLELARGVMDYMTRYPDQVHHPKEDRVFEHVRAADRSLEPLVEALASQHATLLNGGASLRDLLGGALVDGMLIERSAVVDAGRAYVSLQRDHMALESDGIFRAAEELLPQCEWRAIEAEYEGLSDPLFERRVGEDLTRLFEHIREDDIGRRLMRRT